VTRAVLSIGSNVGDRSAQLRAAVRTLVETAELRVVAVSPVYETEPVGGPEQDEFLNAVIVVETELGPERLLELAQRLEQQAGRVRRERWGPRELDVDLVSVDDEVRNDPRLVLPHPRAHERAFVLIPWLDVDRSARLPGYGEVAQLVMAVDRNGVRRRPDLELAR
jgi:2-amino-4-hydroxy-6-hydroxymethyldihydropteridine diphosphokinase